MRVLIVDDEEPARRYLAKILRRIDGVEVVGEAADGIGAIEQARALAPDLVFLDITMPGPSGLQVCQTLMEQPTAPKVVFVTAHNEHAVAAFELEAIDYLLKPAEPQRVARCLERAVKATSNLPILRALEQLRSRPLEKLALLDEEREVRILVDFAEIVWIASQNDKTYALTTKGRLRCMDTLTNVLALLPSTFKRCHRSFVVNLERLERIEPWTKGAYNLVLRGSRQAVPLSRSNAREFKACVNWL